MCEIMRRKKPSGVYIQKKFPIHFPEDSLYSLVIKLQTPRKQVGLFLVSYFTALLQKLTDCCLWDMGRVDHSPVTEARAWNCNGGCQMH